MLEILTLEPVHLVGFRAHWKQAHYQTLIDTRVLSTGWAAIDDVVVAIGGIVEVEKGSISPWLLFSQDMRPRHMLPIFRSLQESLADLRNDGVPVIVDIDPDYPEAARMASMLGFEDLYPVELSDGRAFQRMSFHARIY